MQAAGEMSSQAFSYKRRRQRRRRAGSLQAWGTTPVWSGSPSVIVIVRGGKSRDSTVARRACKAAA